MWDRERALRELAHQLYEAGSIAHILQGYDTVIVRYSPDRPLGLPPVVEGFRLSLVPSRFRSRAHMESALKISGDALRGVTEDVSGTLVYDPRSDWIEAVGNWTPALQQELEEIFGVRVTAGPGLDVQAG